ncbi:MAG: EF-P beta-lysylation protein EpmB [Nannocystaceae bacterium]
MNAGLRVSDERETWQRELASAYTDPVALARDLELPGDFVERLRRPAPGEFPMLVPRPLVARMRRGDPEDPLLRQVLPQADEGRAVPGFVADPLEEHDGALPGLLHKYRSRALILVRGGCAVNCRYCFRRHFPYADHGIDAGGLARILEYVAAHPEINEVILSGGDPLLMRDPALAGLWGALAEIPTIRRLRIHTRMPITLPSRVTDGLLEIVGGARVPAVIVVHVNHPREIDDAVIDACGRLRGAGALLLNQSVLLRRVNDRVDTLVALSERLFDAGILPYYLHLLDRVAGAAHFEVDADRARALMAGLHAELPGFLVPRLVREVAGEASKVPIDLRLGDEG